MVSDISGGRAHHNKIEIGVSLLDSEEQGSCRYHKVLFLTAVCGSENVSKTPSKKIPTLLL